jgi:hypothetical protein
MHLTISLDDYGGSVYRGESTNDYDSEVDFDASGTVLRGTLLCSLGWSVRYYAWPWSHEQLTDGGGRVLAFDRQCAQERS